MIARPIAAIALFLLASCGGDAPAPQPRDNVRAFHRQFNAGNFEQIYDATHPKFRTATTRQDLTAALRATREKLGVIEDSQTIGRRVNFSTAGQQTVLIQDTQHERGSTRETFVLQRDDEALKIIGYNVHFKKQVRVRI